MKVEAFFQSWFQGASGGENPLLSLRHLEAGQKKCQPDFQLTYTETVIKLFSGVFQLINKAF